MTIEMTPLEELDFPTPDLTEAWEPTPAEVTAFTDWFDAEASYKTAVSEWVSAQVAYEMDRYNRLSREYAEVLMTSSERCYCSPSRGMMFDPWRYDIYGIRSDMRADTFTRMNDDLENQITVTKAVNARRVEQQLVEQLVERAETMRAQYAVTPSHAVAPIRRWWHF